MNYALFLGISLSVFVCSIVLGIVKSVRISTGGAGIAPLNILIAGVFVSAVLLFFPLYHMEYVELPNTYFHCVVSSVHHAIQLFTVKANRDIIKACYTLPDLFLSHVYAIFLSAEYIMAPVLSLGFIITFFKNATARLNYLLHYGRDAYIFSELNDRSVTLAASIKKEEPRAVVVFTDVYDREEEEAFDLIREARKLRAICYKKSILGIKFESHSPDKKLCFFTVAEDESKNLHQALELIKRYHGKNHSELYVFSSKPESEYFLNKKNWEPGIDPDEVRMKVRRVNAITSLIYHNLYHDGYRSLYETALPAHAPAAEPSKPAPRQIVAVLAGLGQYGTEMLKSLSWFCQMEEYQLRIEAFDKDPLIRDKLAAACPELIGDAFQGRQDDAFYQIRIHPGIDVTTSSFVQAVKEIKDATYVLVALGSDELNIRTATNMRMYFAQAGVSLKGDKNPRPIIQAIVYNSQKNENLSAISNFKEEPYAVSFIGDVSKSFTQDIILNSVLEHDALEIHSAYYPEETCYEYEYNYRSSCAAAIHIRAIAGELSSIAKKDSTFLPSLRWADLTLKLLPCLEGQAGAGGLTANLALWAKDASALVERVHQQSAFTWDADLAKARIAKDPHALQQWTALCRRLQGMLDEEGKKTPAWSLTPDPYAGLPGPVTLGFLKSEIAAGFREGSEGAVENLYFLLLIAVLKEQEHKRWNAYMRSEGYVYSGNNFAKSRYDLAKMHHDLTQYALMNPQDKNRDVRVDLIIRQIRQMI